METGDEGNVKYDRHSIPISRGASFQSDLLEDGKCGGREF